MLEIIKSEIRRQEYAPEFNTFYLNYMMQMQDEDILNELSYLFRKNSIDASNLSLLIEEDYKKLVEL